MSIVGGVDNRTVVGNTNADPFDSVVAVDTRLSPNGNPGVGSGIVIDPNHVLTAGHVVFNGLGARVTLGENVPALSSRTQTSLSANNDNAAANGFSFPVNSYSGGAGGDDLALATLNQPITNTSRYIGLVAFVDPKDSKGLSVVTAGYPALVENLNIDFANLNSSISKNAQFLITDANGSPSAHINYASGAFLTDAQVMFAAAGTIDGADGDGTFSLSPGIDIEGGQSGSGYWTTLNGDPEPRVLGVASYQNGSDNFGALITTDVYDNIVATMQATPNSLSGNDLPENAIVGSEPGFFSLFTDSGEDNIFGSYRRERILGNGGDDKLFGGAADDRLEGGDGVDQALFSDIFTNYDFTITDPSNPAFEFTHARGSQIDSKDTTKDIEFGVFEFVDVMGGQNGGPDGQDDDGNLFFVPLQVDPDDNTKIKDGSEITPDEDILDDEGEKVGTVTVESPAWMFDGDVDYTLTIGSEQGTLFNFAYIIDSSGSMFGAPLAAVKNAYQSLTQSLINDDIAQNSIFGVVDFDSSASLFAPLDALTAISTINGLLADGLTNFNSALIEARNFFTSQNTSGNENVTNIAYFLSDGENNGPNFSSSAAQLKQLAEVRAFGIGNANLNQLNIIDSNTAVLLSDPTDLITEFSAATVDKDTIERIDVKLAGNVIETISSSQLTEDTLGRLVFEGTINDLEVTREAENEITFEVVFNNGNPTTSLKYKITTGQEQVKDQTDDGTEEIIIFDVKEEDFIVTSVSQSISREIIANDLDNTIEVKSGENTIFGNGGNDRFILSGGINLVDGGEGIDTVQINKTQIEAGSVSKNGNVVNIGTDNTLLNVEFIEFSDVRLAVDTLAITPILSLANQGVLVTEGDNGSTIATFTLNLSSATTKDVVINFATRSDDADTGSDFIATTGQLTIAAGESSGEITLEILGDTEIEGDEVVFLDLEVVSDATFANGATTAIAGVNITDDDSSIAIPLSGVLQTVVEGDPGMVSTLTLTLNRFGGLNESDTVAVEVVSAGDNPAQASDFINGFSTNQVTFAPDESSKTIDVAITGDQDVESNETFGIKITSVSGSASVPTDNILFTILDDDNVNNPPVAGSDTGTTNQGESISINVLANDSDPDGDVIAISSFDETSTEGGNITLDDNNTPNDPTDDQLVYTPEPEFSGKDSFDYTISDGTDTATTRVDIAVVSSGPTRMDDYIVGTNRSDVLVGWAGDDTLFGLGRNDRLLGYQDDDWLFGGNSTDSLEGGSGDDTLYGEQGRDTLRGNDGEDWLDGGVGPDFLYGGTGDDTLYGGEGNDEVFGNAGDDLLFGGNGLDTISGGSGSDTIGLDIAPESPRRDDLILGFSPNEDFFQLPDSIAFEDLAFEDITPKAVVIRLDETEEMLGVVKGLRASNLDIDNFIVDTSL